MKCLRCGKELPEGTVVCDGCGFNFEEDGKIKKIISEKADPVVPEKTKSILIDNPILTFIFGILSVFGMIFFFLYPGFVVLYFASDLILIGLTMLFSKRPAKVKLEPTRNVGVGMAYVALALTIFKAVYFIIGTLFF